MLMHNLIEYSNGYSNTSGRLWQYCSNCSKSSTKFCIPDTKFYVPVLTVSTQDNTKLLKQKASCFKRIISWNKYLSKITNQAQNSYLDFLIDPSFQEWIELRIVML